MAADLAGAREAAGDQEGVEDSAVGVEDSADEAVAEGVEDKAERMGVGAESLQWPLCQLRQPTAATTTVVGLDFCEFAKFRAERGAIFAQWSKGGETILFEPQLWFEYRWTNGDPEDYALAAGEFLFHVSRECE